MDRISPIRSVLDAVKSSTATTWTLVSVVVGLVVLEGWERIEKAQSQQRLQNAEQHDPSLLKKHSEFESFTTASGLTYPRIRVFHKPHLNANKLPNNIPLLVFTHGLGGSASQFDKLLTSLINVAPCLAFDLPGCGLSEFAPTNSKAYSTHALAELVATIIGRYRDEKSGQRVVLIGHSMGCSLNALLESSTSPLAGLASHHIIGMIALCPLAEPLGSKGAAAIRRISWIPSPLFDLFRLYDRRGGNASRSVTRVLGENADEETRKAQMNYNMQSESAPFLRFLAGSIGPKGMPGKAVWSGVTTPLFLVAGESDSITPAQGVENITEWLTSPPEFEGRKNAIIVPAGPMYSTRETAAAEEVVTSVQSDANPPQMDSGTTIKDNHTSTKHAFALKTTVFPPPASHGLLYTPSTVRILSGMIENFLASHVDEHLGAGWQLQHLTTSGKWDVKNLEKWQKVDACSEPIGGLFRAMKTMREVDPDHSPKKFVKKFGANVIPDGVAVVIDISHETPVYHPKGLEEAGVAYHKFPTVSKQHPRPEEVDQFIKLVDQLKKDPKVMGESASSKNTPHPTIAVHCHYGFNRTGFFIVCYLVEREGYRLQDAIEEFGEKRPPGVKHDHFVNELYVRYAVKMPRRGTVIES